MKYKVLLTTSGVGSRLGDLTKYTNKSLVRIGKKPAISYIVESYPKEIPFVVTLGYFGEQVKDFLELAYPERKFEFVKVDAYEGPGTSLGYSMLQAKKNLKCPFIYHACDTLTTDTIPVPNKNWIAGYKEGDTTHYASWKIANKNIPLFSDKGAIDFDYIHIGLVGVYEHEKYWKTLELLYKRNPNDTTLNDCQALEKMIDEGVGFKLVEFANWLDIGNIAALHHARNTVEDHFDNLDKIDESIFLFDNFVIKFFYNKDIIKKRVERAKVLNHLVPKIEGVRDNFYRYHFTKGDLYSRVATPKDFASFLEWAKKNLWVKNKTVDDKRFKEVCRDFYQDKTLKRIEKFLLENNIKDKEDIINGEKIPSIKDLLSKVDFKWLSNTEQYKMHGDFILENIIKTKSSYCLVDWRQDFGGLIESGDRYYDLAKLNHNLTVNHDIISANQFTIKTDGKKVECDILRRQALVDCQKELFLFADKNGFDVKKIRMLSSIIWLNMSPLHHYPFNVFLFYFGKYNLWQVLKKQ